MDNTNDPTNQSEETALDVAPPSAIELVEEEVTETTKPMTEDSTDEPSEDDSDLSSRSPGGLSRLELESLIQRYMEDVEKLKNQIKTQKEMYNASFENDAEFSKETEVANEAKKKVSAVKQRITQLPAVKEAENRMLELKDEMKDVNEAISGLAEQYQNVAGTNQIVRDDGQVLEIVRNFKVIRKKS
jgi:predicted RNase H-like nuclease (RuvC/YqgF family)